jgi:hypothetical protein
VIYVGEATASVCTGGFVVKEHRLQVNFMEKNSLGEDLSSSR